MPREILIETSLDGIIFSKLYSGKEFLGIEDKEPQIMEIEPGFAPVTARYIRIRAMQFGKLPDWHLGAGGDTHIFADEIQIQ